MRPLTTATTLAIGLILSGCTAYSLDGAPDYYGRPAYVAPYAYQPAYIPPYAYGPGWEEGRDRWHDREWREHEERSYQNRGRPPLNQQSHDSRQPPQMAIQRPPPHMASQPPPPARPPADQNRQLLDQLGFKPSR
jgi:hypothetical protein